jgi:hypothetical protein
MRTKSRLPRFLRGCICVATLGFAAAMAVGTSAFASPSLSANMITVGPGSVTDQLVAGKPAQEAISINNSGPDSATFDTTAGTAILLAPSCGHVVDPCDAPEQPDVFSFSSGTGSGGCIGVTFNLQTTANTPTTGELRVQPATVLVLPSSSNCTVVFDVDVLRVPTNDSGAFMIDPAGVQTTEVVHVKQPSVSDAITADFPTISKASPSLAVNGAPATLGNPISAAATLTDAAEPTGNIQFQLCPPEDPFCTSIPIYTTTAPIVGDSASSGNFTPATLGTYRWKATWSATSGDSSNNPATNSPTSCGDAGAASVVSPVPPPPPASTPTAPTAPAAAPAKKKCKKKHPRLASAAKCKKKK